jgi:hypothetical protein
VTIWLITQASALVEPLTLRSLTRVLGFPASDVQRLRGWVRTIGVCFHANGKAGLFRQCCACQVALREFSERADALLLELGAQASGAQGAEQAPAVVEGGVAEDATGVRQRRGGKNGSAGNESATMPEATAADAAYPTIMRQMHAAALAEDFPQEQIVPSLCMMLLAGKSTFALLPIIVARTTGTTNSLTLWHIRRV